MKKIGSISILLLSFFWACEKDKIKLIEKNDSKITKSYKEIDSLLIVFSSEAQKRGKALTFNSTKVKFFDVLAKRGYWGFYNTESKEIELDSTIWFNLDIAEKEWLLYHELGHALLNRDHISMTLKSGEFKSIMYDGRNVGYGNLYFFGFRRKYYIDELLDSNIPLPDWSEKITPYENVKQENKLTIFKETFDNNESKWDLTNAKINNGKLILAKNSGLNTPLKVDYNQNFEIEFEIKSSTAESNLLFNFGEEKNYIVPVLRNDIKQNWIYLTALGTKPMKFNSTQNNTSTYKLTWRSIGDYYYYYINKIPICMLDKISPKSSNPLWFRTLDGEVEIDNLTLSYIK
jgi:hypothetical protein